MHEHEHISPGDVGKLRQGSQGCWREADFPQRKLEIGGTAVCWGCWGGSGALGVLHKVSEQLARTLAARSHSRTLWQPERAQRTEGEGSLRGEMGDTGVELALLCK